MLRGLFINVSPHAIELSTSSRDEISDVADIMDISVTLKLCTCELSHLDLG